MSTQHTQGPWNYGSQPKTAHKVFGTKPGRTYGRITATAHDCGGGIRERNANARLIAAAPELLCWLRCAVEFSEAHNLTRDEDGKINSKPIWFDSAKAAIAKAEGIV